MVHLISVTAASLLSAFVLSFGIYIVLTDKYKEDSLIVGVSTYATLVLTFIGMLWLLI